MYGGVNVCLSLGMLLSENHLRLFFFPYNLVQERSCRLLLPLLLESAMRVRSYVLASHRIASHRTQQLTALAPSMSLRQLHTISTHTFDILVEKLKSP